MHGSRKIAEEYAGICEGASKSGLVSHWLCNGDVCEIKFPLYGVFIGLLVYRAGKIGIILLRESSSDKDSVGRVVACGLCANKYVL